MVDRCASIIQKGAGNIEWRSTAPPTAIGGAPPRQRTAAARMLGRPAGGAGLGDRMKHWSIAVVAAAFGLACICAQAAEPVPVEAFAAPAPVPSPLISPPGTHLPGPANLREARKSVVGRKRGS